MLNCSKMLFPKEIAHSTRLNLLLFSHMWWSAARDIFSSKRLHTHSPSEKWNIKFSGHFLSQWSIGPGHGWARDEKEKALINKYDEGSITTFYLLYSNRLAPLHDPCFMPCQPALRRKLCVLHAKRRETLVRVTNCKC